MVNSALVCIITCEMYSYTEVIFRFLHPMDILYSGNKLETLLNLNINGWKKNQTQTSTEDSGGHKNRIIQIL